MLSFQLRESLAHDTSNDTDPYSAHADAIESVLARACRARRLAPDAADEFRSWARLRLLDHGQAILRKFSGRASFRTYLVTVVGHLFQDWSNHEWGKWRPSSAARRLGPVAIELERLVLRDRHTFAEAAQTLVGRGLVPSFEACRLIWLALPRHPRRQRVDDALLATLPGPGLPDDVLDLGETARRGGEVLEALERAVAGLNPSDRALLRMRYWEGFPASRMAVMAGRDAGRINGRLHRIRRELRRRLHGEGIGAADAARLLRRLESGSAGAAWG